MFKNTGKLLVMVFSLLTMVVGCKDDKQEDPTVLESSVKILEFSGAESSQEVEIRSNCSWEVEVSKNWCTVTPESGKGNGKIEVSVKKNPDAAERTAKIVLTSKGVEDVVISVEQKAAEKSDNTKEDETQMYKVTLLASSSEKGTVSGGGEYESGKSAVLKATPAEGYHFTKWSDGVTTNPRTILVKSDTTLTANFSAKICQITLLASPSDGGTVSGGGKYEMGETIILTATPADGYQFSKWSDGFNANPRIITVTGDQTITAYFVLERVAIVDGKLPGKFSISAKKQVHFSMGNLQFSYRNRKENWRFAENQYDMIGEDNEKISSSYGGWIDLFGWGTSGYNSKYPYMTSDKNTDYGDGSKDIAGTNYDWGVYNAISNGGNKAGVWRTLTSGEWEYLVEGRTNAESLRGQATVNGVTGCVLLPDDWSLPSGLSFIANPEDYTTNSYSIVEWSVMEAAGAVFLPAAGYRNGTMVVRVGTEGYYWSSTHNNNSGAYGLSFHRITVWTRDYSRYFGHSVRLVQE